MTNTSRKFPRFAVCINNTDYLASLELHKIYRIIPDPEIEQDGDIRIIDESGEDYLYAADLFVLTELPRKSNAPFSSEVSRRIGAQ